MPAKKSRGATPTAVTAVAEFRSLSAFADLRSLSAVADLRSLSAVVLSAVVDLLSGLSATWTHHEIELLGAVYGSALIHTSLAAPLPDFATVWRPDQLLPSH